MKKISTIFLLTGLYFSPQVQAQTTYYSDVASIFYTHCTSCHHTGGGGPFSLMYFTETSSMSASISNAVAGNNGILMPPWHADTAYITSGHTGARFLHENTITAVEKNKIIQWVTDGALEGTTPAPTAPSYGDMTYKLNGTASLALKIPTFASNSTTSNSNPYDCFSLPTGLQEDRWLRAFEIIPGNKTIVHHVVVSVDTAATKTASNLSGNCGNQPGQIGVGGWSAGSPPTVFPDSGGVGALRTGIRIPKGSNFVLQIHYAPGSTGQLDSTKIRLFFYPIGATGIRPMHSDVMLQNWDVLSQISGNPSIPKDLVTTFSATSASSQFSPTKPTLQPTGDMTLFSANPHSHNVCTKIKIYASNNALDTIPVIRISSWNYQWQGNYYYPKLLKIPAGYILKTEHIYDNTVNNPHLPAGVPRVNVKFGQATSDEMLFDAFLWLDYQTGDENIDVKALLANDPLLQIGNSNIVGPDTLAPVGINKIDAPSIQSFIYPNPASDNISIYLTKKSVYKGRIFNITGQTILNTETFLDKLTVDVKNIPAGLYVIEIVDTKTNDRITKKIVISN